MYAIWFCFKVIYGIVIPFLVNFRLLAFSHAAVTQTAFLAVVVHIYFALNLLLSYLSDFIFIKIRLEKLS